MCRNEKDKRVRTRLMQPPPSQGFWNERTENLESLLDSGIISSTSINKMEMKLNCYASGDCARVVIMYF